MLSIAIILMSQSAIDLSNKLHPVESFCVEYDERSAFLGDGWRKTCSRNYGAETFSISYRRGEGGNVRTGEKWDTACHLHTIETGEKVYTFDLIGDAAIVHQNPKLELMRASAASYAAEQTLDSFVAPYGYTPTGETDIVAGEPCFEFENIPGRSKACYSEDLLLLRLLQTGFADYEMVATKISIGEAGGDENYRLYETRPVTELAPNQFYIFQCARISDETG